MKPFEERERKDGPITYKISFWYEEYPDVSYWGKYSSDWEPGAIDCVYTEWGGSYEGWRRSREYRYFIPDCDPSEVESSRDYYYRAGESKGPAWYMATRIPLRQYHAMEALNRQDWYYYGIEVKAYIDGEEIGWESLWGLESSWYDAEWGWGSQDDYADEVIDELIGQCKASFPKRVEELMSVVEKLDQVVATGWFHSDPVTA
jgi:hypothetical protein